MTDPTVFSVLIFTEHDPQSLARTLAALRDQDFSPALIEVLVLDPSDDPARRKVADRYGARYQSVEGANEPAGLNTGLFLARGKFIAITDDDCRPGAGWLDCYHEVLADGAALAGGPDRVPDDARRFLKHLDYIMTSLAGCGGLRTAGRCGAAYYPRRWNMAFTRSAIDRVGGFDGRLNDTWELDFASRIRGWHGGVMFVSKAMLWHERDTRPAGFLLRNLRLAASRAALSERRLAYALPAIAATAAILLAFVSPHQLWAWRLLLCGASSYGLLLAVSGLHAFILNRDPSALFLIPLLLFLQHTTHALGYIAGIVMCGGSLVRQSIYRYIGRRPRI